MTKRFRAFGRSAVALALLCTVWAHAQVLGDGAPDLLNTAARVPLSLEFGGENVFAPRVGFRVGGSLYPLPLLLDRELNADGFADVTYTLRGGVGNFLASASAALYTGVGPRYRLINSELFLDGSEPGTYLGAGGVAGAEFRLGAIGFSLVSAFVEAGNDYIWPAGEPLGKGRFSPRVRVGLGIPFVSF